MRFTRGIGLLEPWLARRRAGKANKLIPPSLRTGRILDIGCGSYPYFLAHSTFTEKFAIDQQRPHSVPADIHWHVVDLNREPMLPFETGFFSVVSMLAVIEHLDPNQVPALFRELHRVLHPGGIVILTTPAAWSDPLLRAMAAVRLVSAEEIQEHAYAYTLPLIGWYFGNAGFPMQKVRFGYFELGLNMWAIAER